jgi:hypothetical protein
MHTIYPSCKTIRAVVEIRSCKRRDVVREKKAVVEYKDGERGARNMVQVEKEDEGHGRRCGLNSSRVAESKCLLFFRIRFVAAGHVLGLLDRWTRVSN